MKYVAAVDSINAAVWSAGTMASLQYKLRAATPAAFREQLDGSDKRVPYLNIYECDPFGTSSFNDNIIKRRTDGSYRGIE